MIKTYEDLKNCGMFLDKGNYLSLKKKHRGDFPHYVRVYEGGWIDSKGFYEGIVTFDSVYYHHFPRDYTSFSKEGLIQEYKLRVTSGDAYSNEIERLADYLYSIGCVEELLHQNSFFYKDYFTEAIYKDVGEDHSTKCYIQKDGDLLKINVHPSNNYLLTHNYINFNSVWYPIADGIYTVMGRLYPLSVLIAEASICECGEIYFGGGEYCPNCASRFNSEVLSYSAKATDYFKFKIGKNSGKNPIFMGVELELENRTPKNIMRTKKLLSSHCILKRDSSVSGGFEIVSAPATFEVHLEEFSSFFSEVDSLGLDARSNCGMHVHIGRKGLTSLQIGKMVNFMNLPDNRSLISHIAERESSYAKTKSGVTVTSAFKGEITDRYTALNLQNKDTIEFRIFASTTKWENFVKNLEFCSSLVAYCSPGNCFGGSIKEHSYYKNYLAFLQSNRKAYPHLNAFVKEFN